MAEKIQLKRTLKTVLGELKRLCLHVDAAGVENKTAQGRKVHRGKCCRKATNRSEREKIQRDEVKVRVRMIALNSCDSLLCLLLVAAHQDDVAICTPGEVPCSSKTYSNIRSSNENGFHCCSRVGLTRYVWKEKPITFRTRKTISPMILTFWSPIASLVPSSAKPNMRTTRMKPINAMTVACPIRSLLRETMELARAKTIVRANAPTTRVSVRASGVLSATPVGEAACAGLVM